MAFQKSGRDFVLDGSVLKGELDDRQGNPQFATFDLDTIIGNEDGLFLWDGVNFTQTASNVRLQVRDDSVYIIASLQKRDGSWDDDAGLDISLGIENIDGTFQRA